MLVRSLSGIVLVLFISGAIGGTTQAGSGAKPTEQPKATASIKSKQPSVGEGCKSTLKTLVENGLAWGKSCSIGANQWRVWCLNGSLYDEAHPCPKGEA